MNCDQARAIAALAVSGDVSAVELQEFNVHAAMCEACRAEVAGFEALLGQLEGMRGDELPGAACAAVRARVISEIGGRRHRRWVVAWSSAAATACVIAAVFASHREAPVAVLRATRTPLEVASVQGAETEIPAPVAARHIRRAVRRIAQRRPPEPIVVHMFTNDPNVVIYWVADAKKEIAQ